MDNYIVGRNAVKEALRSGRSIQRIMVSEDKVKTSLADIVGLAKSQGIEVRPTPIKQMNNATVAKTSAGAIEQIPLVQVGNVAQTIKQLQKQGFWVMGAHMEGDRTLYEADMTIPTVIVIGNEGKGISRVVKEACDFLVTIPMYGNLNSLNASVAAAVLMYEAVRQRQAK